MRVWVDTDVGDNPDDSVALLLARAHPDADLVGVSIAGDGTERRADLARSLLGDGWRGPVTDGSGLDVTIDGSSPDAVVAVGPLTNLVGLHSDVTVTVMGGALRAVAHRARVRRVESNFGADPAAARAVLRTTMCRVVPLDVTARMVVTDDGRAALAEAHPELARQLADWPHALCLHDPLALLVALGDVEFDEDVERITVDPKGKVVRGRGIEQRVVVDADTDAARTRILELLS